MNPTQQLIIDLAETIPRGRWTSYGDFARILGIDARAVGQIMVKMNGKQIDPADCILKVWRIRMADGSVEIPSHWSDPADRLHLVIETNRLWEQEGGEIDPAGRAVPRQRFTLAAEKATNSNPRRAATEIRSARRSGPVR